MSRHLSVPLDALADEIECAIAFLVACNRDRAWGLLLPAPEGTRREFAAEIARMLVERAERGLSGMTVCEDNVPAGGHDPASRA
jgi:hypothetical protein